jgi:hypothetical protein
LTPICASSIFEPSPNPNPWWLRLAIIFREGQFAVIVLGFIMALFHMFQGKRLSVQSIFRMNAMDRQTLGKK